MKLNVFRGNLKVGSLDILADEPFYGFAYNRGYLAAPGSLPLSLSLPLTESRYAGEQAQPYFEGLLPEGAARDAIARRLGVPRTSSVKLLRALGRDCAGDISIIEESGAADISSKPSFGHDMHEYSPFEDGLRKIAERPQEEIPRLQENTRLSLAGGQEKIALYHNQGDDMEQGWFIPLSGSPSTHIIKPGMLETHYPHLTLNEFLCLRAASECGIRTTSADILYPETPVLIIERYDRIIREVADNGLNKVGRVHQEDFCQACGVKSDFKYEHDGGLGFNACRNVLAKYATRPIEDIMMFVKWALFNYLIGNCDAHAKNISILHHADATVSLAPAYDLLSTTIYDGKFGSKLSRSMGMGIGIHENIDRIKGEDFNIFASDVHMRRQQIKSIGDELASKLPLAFGVAARMAESKGFAYAGELADRIVRGSAGRAAILTS